MGLLDFISNFFKKKHRLHAYIIDEIDGLEIKRVVVKGNTFTISKGLFDDRAMTYIVDNAYVVYRLKDNMPCAFYFKNNPNPLGMFHKRNVDVDAVGFKKILDDKTVQDLFSPEGVKKLDIVLILVIVNILMSIVLLLIQFKVIKVGG